MREIISISTLLFLLAVAGTEARTAGDGKTCRVNLIVAVVDGC
ncbi:MAG: hypothetical protein ACOY4T_02820 [Pseudomonadota bacterium]|jgi:hypothetical protein